VSGDARELVRHALTAFAGRKVVVLGDLMLDEYLWGDVHRISPEAPVPVVRVKRESVRAGGAGNVAANIATLGGLPLLHGVVGDDGAATRLLAALAEYGIATAGIHRDPTRPTTLKTRIIAHSQQVVRADREDDRPIAPATESLLLDSCLAALATADALVFSDYAKGVLTQRVIKEVLSAAHARGIPSIVDPAYGEVSRYQPVTVLKLNHREAVAACGEIGPAEPDPGRTEAVAELGQRLLRLLDARAVLITCGSRGMVMVERGGPTIAIPATAREVYDVTGAGDTVTAALALALAASMPLGDAAFVANLAAAVVVGKVGTAVVTAEELAAAADRA